MEGLIWRLQRSTEGGASGTTGSAATSSAAQAGGWGWSGVRRHGGHLRPTSVGKSKAQACELACSNAHPQRPAPGSQRKTRKVVDSREGGASTPPAMRLAGA
ncbi:hypothetical protein [Rubritalea tangerina]|uniref:hypothetical protein n=1 Tax=Rubritalea tangerina TaxID=430798 RepID=UPI003622ADFA